MSDCQNSHLLLRLAHQHTVFSVATGKPSYRFMTNHRGESRAHPLAGTVMIMLRVYDLSQLKIQDS